MIYLHIITVTTLNLGRFDTSTSVLILLTLQLFISPHTVFLDTFRYILFTQTTKTDFFFFIHSQLIFCFIHNILFFELTDYQATYSCSCHNISLKMLHYKTRNKRKSQPRTERKNLRVLSSFVASLSDTPSKRSRVAQKERNKVISTKYVEI